MPKNSSAAGRHPPIPSAFGAGGSGKPSDERARDGGERHAVAGDFAHFAQQNELIPGLKSSLIIPRRPVQPRALREASLSGTGGRWPME